ncbi:hypothetical protein MMC34_005060 [Xylographa carneopallida]|nr:hypothetical protein [Xylographa carneopallida]
MSPHSPVPIATTIPQTSQPPGFQNLHLTGTLSFSTLSRLLTSVFTFIAITLLIVGPSKLSHYESPGSTLVAFPLIFLFLSLFSHIAVEVHYVFTELIYVEWRRPDLRTHSGSLLCMPERLQHLKRPKRRALVMAYGGAGVGMGFGALLVAAFPLCNGVMIAGVVFTLLTAVMHVLLAVVPENGYRLTLTFWEENQERQVREGYVSLAEDELNGEPIDLKSMA